MKQCRYIPFRLQGVQYNGCTVVDGDNGQPWCSTQVDSIGTLSVQVDRDNGQPLCSTQVDSTGTLSVQVDGDNSQPWCSTQVDTGQYR